MKKNINKLCALSLAIMMTLSLSACGGEELSAEEKARIAAEQRLTQEMQQNDFRGGYTRTMALKSNVIDVLEGMKANNDIIRQDSPNSFWTAEGYQDFVSTFLDISIIEDTRWFNEEEGSWDTTLEMIEDDDNSFTEDGKLRPTINIIRLEKDDYSITGVPWNMNILLGDTTYTYSGEATYRVLYDCDKDWCKAYSVMYAEKSLPQTMVELFEYRRVDNDTFAIQTSRERLYIVLQPAEADTDIRERDIKEFYYSKIVGTGQRTTFKPFSPLPEVTSDNTRLGENIALNETIMNNPAFNELGECCTRYGDRESLFYVAPADMTREWVYQDKSLQQAISYKDGILMATTYNKLSDSYERYIYARYGADTNISKELEQLVEIKSLVGVVEVDIVATVGASDALKTAMAEQFPEVPATVPETAPVIEIIPEPVEEITEPISVEDNPVSGNEAVTGE